MFYACDTMISKLEDSKEMMFYSDVLFGFLNKAVVWGEDSHQISDYYCHWLAAILLSLS